MIKFSKSVTHERGDKIRNKGKLIPCYIGPFDILDRVGSVDYRLALSLTPSWVHLMFYVSMLKNYHGDGDYFIM